MPHGELLTSPQVARKLGVSARTVHRLVAAGRLTPEHKLASPNGAFLFTEQAVDEYLRDRETAA